MIAGTKRRRFVSMVLAFFATVGILAMVVTGVAQRTLLNPD
jgi:hypothetical protein